MYITNYDRVDDIHDFRERRAAHTLENAAEAHTFSWGGVVYSIHISKYKGQY